MKIYSMARRSLPADFFGVVSTRCSTRAYERREVEEPKVKAILESAASAPSAGGLQAYQIVVVRDRAAKRRLATASSRQEFVGEAPVVLVFFSDPERSAEEYGERGGSLYALQDATIACSYAQLAATALGLSTCWVGAFDDRAVARILDAPNQLKPVAVLPVGYAAELADPVERRPLGEIVMRERF